MTWDPNVSVSITTGANPVDREVLNIPLFVGVPTFPERVRTYGSYAEAAADPQLTANELSAAEAHFAQQLHAPQLKIGRSGDASVAQVVTWTIAGTPLEDEVYSITINGVETQVIAGASPTVTSVHTALAAAVTTAVAAQDVTIGGVDPDITCTADNAGEQFSYTQSVTPAPGQSASGTLTAVLTTASSGISSDLDAILAEDDGWYGVTNGPSGITLAVMKSVSAWCEINEKIYIAQSDDADVLTATAANDLEELAAQNRRRTVYLWHHDSSEYASTAWMAFVFWTDPDERTTIWAYKNLSGISTKPTPLTTTEQGNITSQYGNCYVKFGGNGNTGMGITTTNRKIDLIWTEDWLEARLNEAYTQLLSDVSQANSKIGLNDKELQAFVNAGQKILDQGVRVGHLLEDSTSISVPKRADMPAADVTSRTVRVTAAGVATGAGELVVVTMAFTLT